MSGMMTAMHAVGGFFAGMWKDRARVAASFFGAWILWFLIGQRIEVSYDVPCPVRIVAAGESAPEGHGLFIHVPDDLVVLQFDPDNIELTVVGKKEEVTRLNRQIRGDMNLSPEFCNQRDQRTGVVQIGSDFTFGKIGGRTGLRLESPGTIELTVSRRGKTTIPLDPENLVFGTAGSSIGAAYDVSFVPSVIDVDGPIADIAQLKKFPGRLRLSAIGSPEAYAEGRSLSLRGLTMVDENGVEIPNAMVRSPDQDAVLVTVQRKRSWQKVALKNVPITAFVPEASWRSNAVAERPVKIDPAKVDVEIRVPDEYFEAGNEEGDLNRDVFLFVNLAEMQPDVEAQRLPVRFFGLPEGATIEFKLPTVGNSEQDSTVDVVWQLSDGS